MHSTCSFDFVFVSTCLSKYVWMYAFVSVNISAYQCGLYMRVHDHDSVYVPVCVCCIGVLIPSAFAKKNLRSH